MKMKNLIAIFGLATLVGCGGNAVQSTYVPDGSVPDTDSMVADVDGGVPQVDSGTDSGNTQPDAGTQPTGSCLDTDTDTGTYTVTWTALKATVPHFNIDGVGNENSAAGCGISDGIGAANTDNGFGNMANALLLPVGLNVDATLTDALEPHNAGGDLTVTMVFTHVRSDIASNPNDSCVAVRFDVSRALAVFPSVSGEGEISNRRFLGTLDGPLGLHFPMGTAYPGKVLDMEVREPVIDVVFNNTFSALDQLNSYVGGYLFWAPPAGDPMPYAGFATLDAALFAVAGSNYTTQLRPNIPQYLDLHMASTGEQMLCSPTAAPNSLAVTFQIGATNN